jgi:tetratricopeptide (TPR) repeat protein
MMQRIFRYGIPHGIPTLPARALTPAPTPTLALALALAPALALALSLAGCPKPGPAGTKRPAPRGVTRLTMEPIMIVAHRSGGRYTTEAFSADELFRKGLAAQKTGRCKPALAAYAKLLKHFGGSVYAAPTHYNAALCWQRRQKWHRAGRHFEAAARGVQKPAEQIQALGAAGVNYAEDKRWADSRRCFETLLSRKDLQVQQRIEAHARLAYAWYKSGNNSRTRNHVDQALALYRKTRTTVRLPSLHYVAMAAYYKAAIYHRLSSQTPIRLPVEQMQQDVETMATWMFKAQKAYWRAVSYKDHLWAMAATYQVGTLYWEFRRALTGAPLPRFTGVRYFDKTLKRYETITANEQRAAYVTKLRTKTRVLLRHAMAVYQKGLSTAERIGAKSRWVTKMRKSLTAVKLAYAGDPQRTDGPAAIPNNRHPTRSPLVPRTIDPKTYRPTAIEL